MRHIVRNSIIVLVATLIAIMSIIPPEKKLTLGKDLAGGVSLVYQVDIKPGERNLLPLVIEVLKNRVNPNGTLDITITEQGTDRIEITMPLPTAKVKKLKEQFERELDALALGVISADEFETVVKLPAADREKELVRLSAGDPARLTLLTEAATKNDELAAAKSTMDEKVAARDQAQLRATERETELKAATPEGPVPEGVTPPDPEQDETLIMLRLATQNAQSEANKARTAMARAAISYETAREKAISAAISKPEINRALSLTNKKVTLRDNVTKKVAELPSPRAEALDRIRAAHPASGVQLDKVIERWNIFESERSTLDDERDLMRMLRGAGVLDFRITVKPGTLADEQRLRTELQEKGPRNVRADQARWYKINKIQNWIDSVQDLELLRTDPAGFFRSRPPGFVAEEYDGEYYMLCWDTAVMRLTHGEGDWRLASAGRGQDQLGRPSIAFQMDALGASLLGRLTGANVQNQMAVLLDDEVYTAPTLESRIASNGQITGSFSEPELQYIIRVLSAGSLQAKLAPEPISVTKLAPELGADNLRQGLYAGVVSFVAISIFMVCYYFFGGAVAVFALLLNALLILGAMALQRAAFSLPGIAGVILTFGQAVDCNVLIYERVREELRRGHDLRSAIRMGHERAMASIVDGNMTNFIVCIVLYLFGTQEIKGFALTLGLGIVMTLFTGVFVTRLVFTIFIEKLGLRRMRMLPMVWPALERALIPRIDWLGLRFFSLVISGLSVVIGLAAVAYQGVNMLDTEFRGGTAVTIQLAQKEGQPQFLERKEIQNHLDAIAGKATDEAIKTLASADIVVVNPQPGGVKSDRFTIKTVATDANAVRDALVEEFQGLIDSQPALRFKGSESANAAGAPVFQILDRSLGKSLGRPEITLDVRDFFGGAAILLEELAPKTSVAQIQSRLDQLRSQPDFAAVSGRTCRVEPLRGSVEAVESAVVLVYDKDFADIADQGRWNRDLRDVEWRLVRTALTEATMLASVQSFSPSVAATFKAQAVVSIALSTLLIMVYVWVRFGTFRYSVAAIITTAHDCLVAVGFIAFAQILYEHYPKVAEALLIKPFKIDLNMVASILTVLGYSLNDTIIVLDRVRENRGKLTYATRQTVNSAINDTVSRTVITSGTTVISCAVLYLFGGEGVRGFAYCLLVGVIVGTYSSIAVASPLVWVRKADPTHRDEDDLTTSSRKELARA